VVVCCWAAAEVSSELSCMYSFIPGNKDLLIPFEGNVQMYVY